MHRFAAVIFSKPAQRRFFVAELAPKELFIDEGQIVRDSAAQSDRRQPHGSFATGEAVGYLRDVGQNASDRGAPFWFLEVVRDGKLREFVAVCRQLGRQAKQDRLQFRVIQILELTAAGDLTLMQERSLVRE